MSTLILPKPSTQPDLYHGKWVAGLFASGEQGVWYDPSDLSTLYQDAAGTTPVTAVGQPVGRMLDKSGRGNHAYQSTSASRPVLSARYNLISQSEDFSGWSKRGGSITSTNEISPIGTLNASVFTASSTNGEIYRAVAVTSGVNYKGSIYIKRKTGSGTISIRNSANTAWIPITADLSQWVQVANDGGAAGALAYCDILVSNAGDEIYIWGADLRVANESTTIPSYQRVNTATDYDTAGYPLYLSFDGVDDYLSTGSINFTSTDKMTVLAGVRKLSDAAFSIIIEHGNPTITPDYNNSPTTMLGASSRSVDPVNGASYSSALNSGIANANVSLVGIAIYKAPITSIISIRQDRTKSHGSEEIKFRHNAVDISGIVVANNNPTGNYGNFPLYIGRRGGTSVPFNGNLYGLIVRGAATDDAHLTHAEKYLAYKSGVTL